MEYSFKSDLSSVLFEAVLAIHRSSLSGFEGNLGFASASVTNYGVHPSLTGSSTATVHLPGFPAVGAAFGLVLETFFLVKFLLTNCEDKLLAAVLADQGSFSKTHTIHSLKWLINLDLSTVIFPTLFTEK